MNEYERWKCMNGFQEYSMVECWNAYKVLFILVHTKGFRFVVHESKLWQNSTNYKIVEASTYTGRQ